MTAPATGLPLRLQRAGVRRGAALGATPAMLLASSFPALDRQIGGFPRGALTEVLLPGPGRGELALVMPALRAAIAEHRLVAWIAPPHRPYAPALAQYGLALERQWLVRAGQPDEAAWAARELLCAGCVVLCWAPLAAPTTLRRLQLAAERGGGCGFLYRPAAAAHRPSPAALRLLLGAGGKLQILKCRHGVRDPRAGRTISLTEPVETHERAASVVAVPGIPRAGAGTPARP